MCGFVIDNNIRWGISLGTGQIEALHDCTPFPLGNLVVSWDTGIAKLDSVLEVLALIRDWILQAFM